VALVLSLHSGQDFYVGDEQVVVGAILGVSKFEVTVTSSGRKYVVSDEQATELTEIGDVFLSAGDRPQAGVARIAIDAPRSITILRGDALRSGEAKVERVNPGRRFV
jgi:sRNA-binding carbon storage regulator CsrA